MRKINHSALFPYTAALILLFPSIAGSPAMAADPASQMMSMAQTMYNMMEAMRGNDDIAPPPALPPEATAAPDTERPPGALDGLWESPSGELLLIHGQHFRLHAGADRQTQGIIQTRGRYMAMRSTQAQRTWFYEYAEQDGRLAMRDSQGQIYLYRRREAPKSP